MTITVYKATKLQYQWFSCRFLLFLLLLLLLLLLATTCCGKKVSTLSCVPQMADKKGRVGVFVVAVFILVAATAPLQSHGAEEPLDRDGEVLKQLISHNKDLSGRLTLAMGNILQRRQTSGCTLGKIN